MATIRLVKQAGGQALPRTPVSMLLQGELADEIEVKTDDNGIAYFPNASGNARILVKGQTVFNGILGDDIEIALDQLDHNRQQANTTLQGLDGGSMAYTGMQIDYVEVNGCKIKTCSEGYIVQPAEWSEDFALALAAKEELELTDEIWEIIYYLRTFYSEKHVQCTVRDMIKHFRKIWGKEKGSNKYLHQIFPRGGPQKQGNRLAGLLRTKGEH